MLSLSLSLSLSLVRGAGAISNLATNFTASPTLQLTSSGENQIYSGISRREIVPSTRNSVSPRDIKFSYSRVFSFFFSLRSSVKILALLRVCFGREEKALCIIYLSVLLFIFYVLPRVFFL